MLEDKVEVIVYDTKWKEEEMENRKKKIRKLV